MLSFSPGELSTIEGPIVMNSYYSRPSSWTKQFNLRDLPCPPQSVMEANWYKPEPGEPYRPLIAMPSQLKQRIPWFSFCENIFTAYDPPRALRSAPALAPVITRDSDPQTQKPTAAPSHTVDLGARKTAASKTSISVPMAAHSGQETPSLPTDVDPESSSDPKKGTNFGQSGDVTGDPGKQADPNVPDRPLQSDAVVNSNQDPNHKASSIVGNEPKQDDKGDPTGNDPGQEAAGASQITNPETATLVGMPEDPKSASKVPDQLPQRILTTIAGHAITANPTAVAIAGTAINPGDPAVSIGGTRIALNNAGSLILNSKTIPLASGPPLPETLTTMIANQPITANPTAVAMAGTTLRPGDPAATIGGTQVALNTAGSLILGSKIISLASDPPFPETFTTNIADQPVTANPTAVTIAGTTLRPGDPAIMVGGTLVGLDTAGRYFLLGSKTIPLEATQSAKLLVTTVAGQTITAAASAIDIAGTTLSKGGTGFEINGTVISLDTAGRFVVGSKTQTFEGESVDSGDSTVGVSGPTGPLASTTTAVEQSGVSNRTDTAATTGVQAFTGEAGGLKCKLLWIKVVVAFIAGLVW